VRVEIEPSGKIIVLTGKPGEASTEANSSWDKAIADLEEAK
jgi:hypothetical protein